MIDKIRDLIGNDLYAWGDDEDGDTVIVFNDWGGITRLGEAIVAHLVAEELVDAKSRCDGSDEFNPFIELFAKESDFIKIACAITACFGAKMFGECDISEKFTTPGDEDGLCQAKFEVRRLIDKAGLEMGFSDTYDYCIECSTLIYTQPSSYGDYGRYRCSGDGVICRACDLKNPEGYLEEYLEDLKRGEVRGFTLPFPEGFREISEEDTFMGEPRTSPVQFERGLHIGQRDNPKKQYKALKEIGITDVLFDVSTGQFDVTWTVYVRNEDYDKAKALLLGKDLADAKGPGDYAAEALKSVSLAQSKLGHVAVTTINTDDGTATTRQVSHQDFIEGKALRK